MAVWRVEGDFTIDVDAEDDDCALDQVFTLLAYDYPWIRLEPVLRNWTTERIEG